MATTATRWNLVISTKTDTERRHFLASQGGGRKGDLFKFVEEAVRARVFDLLARCAREENGNASRAKIEAAVAEALAWARSEQ